MATTRTQSAIEADLAAAQRGTGGCSYYHDNMSTLTTTNYNRFYVHLNMSRKHANYDQPYPRRAYADVSIYLECKSCKRQTPYTWRSFKTDYQWHYRSSSSYEGNYLDLRAGTWTLNTTSPYYMLTSGTNVLTINGSNFTCPVTETEECNFLTTSRYVNNYNQISIPNNTSISISHTPPTVDSTTVNKYRTELNEAITRDNAITAFNKISLEGVPNRETAQQALAQLELALTTGGSSYSGYQTALAKYNEYTARLSKQEQLTLSIESLSRLHENITNTMLPNKVNKYTEIHTDGIERYNGLKTYIAENLS